MLEIDAAILTNYHAAILMNNVIILLYYGCAVLLALNLIYSIYLSSLLSAFISIYLLPFGICLSFLPFDIFLSPFYSASMYLPPFGIHLSSFHAVSSVSHLNSRAYVISNTMFSTVIKIARLLKVMKGYSVRLRYDRTRRYLCRWFRRGM